jgi:rare lipoprotein A
MADDPYARPDPAGDPYAAPARDPYARQQPVRDPYAQPEPQQQDAYARPGADYARPDARPDTYAAPPTQTYRDPGADMPGPRGSSQPGSGEERYDEVGYAGVRGVSGGDANGGAVVAVARSVAPGTFLEVTSLDTGRTILVLVTGQMDAGADHPVDLSPAAARLLGAPTSTIAVRVRKVAASPADQAALRAGQPANERVDTPPVLLTALRKHLPAGGGTPAPVYDDPAPGYPSAPVSRPPARPAPAAGRAGYYVQVGAFSNAANAQALARSLGGFVRPGGGLNRVQLGPFRSTGEAEAARARAAQHGYPDAKVFAQN